MKVIKFALLPGDQVPIGYSGIVAGKGTMDQASSLTTPPGFLQVLTVKKVECANFGHPSRVCFRSYSDDNVGDIGAGYSGGPVYDKTVIGREVLLGLVSRSSDLCHKVCSRLFWGADVYESLKEILDFSRRGE